MSDIIQYNLTWTDEMDKELVGLVRPDLTWGRLRKIGYVFGPPSAVLSAAIVFRFGGVVGREGFFALIVGAFLGFLVERLARRLFRSNARLDRNIDATRSGKWNLSADGLSFENEMFSTWRSWALISGVIEKNWGILLWMGTVIPLPDKDLTTDTDRTQILRRINDWRTVG